MIDSLTKYEQYTVICLNSDDYTYFERIFTDESSMHTFINELKTSENCVGRIFVAVSITSKSLIEVV